MKKIYIANWKMTMSPEESFDFYHDNQEELSQLAKQAYIILCPSFLSLGMLSCYMEDDGIFLGAQNCSEHEEGAFTGEVDALSLQQLGCAFCIVGHSERRALYNETDAIIAKKVEQLIAQSITPIICIGETKEHYESQQTSAALEAQLSHICTIYKDATVPLYFAYEPVWAIGTGMMPSVQQLNAVVAWLRFYVQEHIPTATVRYLYGGSVNPETVKSLKTIQGLDGFLIGGASSDFQTFKNIVV